MSCNPEQQEPLLLAIDNGTQSVRALLFDLKGNIVGQSKIELEPYFSHHPGWAEQDAEYYWQSLSQACRQLWRTSGIDKGRVKGVSLTTQRGTYVCVDGFGRALRPAITWLDQRLADNSEPMKGFWRPLFKVIGFTKTIEYFRSRCYSRWLIQNEPDIWAKTEKYLLLSGWHTLKLTGHYRDSVGCQVGYIPLNYKKQRWAALWDWKWQASELQPHQLPELVKPGDILGSITSAAAEITGIPEGLPLIASAADKACEVLGSGANDPHTASLSYGTTATVNTVNYRYIEPLFLIPSFPSAIPDAWNAEFMIYRGYWMVSWFKQQFGHPEVHHAESQGIMAEELFDDLINAAPAGSMGLMLQPYWSPGLKTLEAKGGIIGFGDVHTRAHIYRSIVEGLAYALREGKENLERRSGKKINRLVVSGGGSQSDGAMQLTADIFNMPVERPHTYETSGLGAVINAAVGLGLYPDYKTAVSHMTRSARVFQPDPDNARLYDRLYKEVYRKMYKRLQPLYRKIGEITGYPG